MEGGSNCIKVILKNLEISPKLLYTVLMDDDFMRETDDNIAEWKIVKKIDDHNDISYYAAKSPIPLIAPRDFLNLRSYGQIGENEYIIFMRAHEDDEYPERDGFVRAKVHVLGYYIVGKDGVTSLYYMTRTDFNGWVPQRAVDFLAKIFAPVYASKVIEAAKKYEEIKKNRKK